MRFSCFLPAGRISKQTQESILEIRLSAGGGPIDGFGVISHSHRVDQASQLALDQVSR